MLHYILTRVSVTVKRQHYHSNFYKGKYLAGADFQFQRFIHYHHGENPGSLQADMLLEKELRVLHLDHRQQKERPCATLGIA